MNWLKHSISKNGLLLAAFTLATTGLIGITHYLTADTIAQQEQKTLLSTIDEVLNSIQYDNDLYRECHQLDVPELGPGQHKLYPVRWQNSNKALVVESTAPDGYSGKIKLLTAITRDGTIAGTRVLQHKETPGLGDKIDLRISNWILSFNGKPLAEVQRDTWGVKKDGGQFDQFTGATITPRAVVKQLKHTVLYVHANRDALFQARANCQEK